jgi:hypothetical protein
MPGVKLKKVVPQKRHDILPPPAMEDGTVADKHYVWFLIASSNKTRQSAGWETCRRGRSPNRW